jgi:hypothetical protein
MNVWLTEAPSRIGRPCTSNPRCCNEVIARVEAHGR